jgi:1-acyl-sn-glycerol-3-phosphate acyltransferase
MPLVVFPEGGRSTDGHLQNFLGGTFYVAIKAQAPIIPMAIVGAFEALPMNTFVICPNRFRLIVGEPIPTAGMVSRDMEALSAKVHQAMSELFYANSKLPTPVPESQPENSTI